MLIFESKIVNKFPMNYLFVSFYIFYNGQNEVYLVRIKQNIYCILCLMQISWDQSDIEFHQSVYLFNEYLDRSC